MTRVKTNCFNFIKIENHNNERDVEVKTSQLGNGGKSLKTLFTFSDQNNIHNSILKYCTRILNHPVYGATNLKLGFNSDIISPALKYPEAKLASLV